MKLSSSPGVIFIALVVAVAVFSLMDGVAPSAEGSGAPVIPTIDVESVLSLPPSVTIAPIITPPAVLSSDNQRFWSGAMDIPDAGEIAAFRASDRSPYISCWPTFEDCDGFTDIAVDIEADYLPRGTYVCGCQFDLDMSELQSKYAQVYRQYNGVGGYAGLQVLEDGTHVAILSIWDTYCVDASGGTTVLRARRLYPEESDNDSFTGEGNGAHCLVPYDWQAGRTYRLRVSEGTSVEDGQCVLALSVCDLETGEWTELVYYALGVDYTYMKTPCSFLENFLPETAGEVRSVRWSNYRAKSAVTGTWVPAKSAILQQFTGTGSYNYGSDDSSFWAITTGLPDRCSLPESPAACTVTQYAATSP